MKSSRLKRTLALAAFTAVCMTVAGGVTASAETTVDSATGSVSYAIGNSDSAQTNINSYDFGYGLTAVFNGTDKYGVFRNGQIVQLAKTNMKTGYDNANLDENTPMDAFVDGYAKYVAPSDGSLKYKTGNYTGAIKYGVDGTIEKLDTGKGKENETTVKEGNIVIFYCSSTNAGTVADRGLTSLTFTPNKVNVSYTFTETLDELNEKELTVTYSDLKGTGNVTKNFSETGTTVSGGGQAMVAVVINDVPATTTITGVTIQ